MLMRFTSRLEMRAFVKRASCMLMLLGFLSATALSVKAADDTLYGITNNSPFTIYTIDSTTGVATSVSTLSFASASLARNPTSGLLFYTAVTASGGRYQVATWDPSTSANTILTSTINVYLPRLA